MNPLNLIPLPYRLAGGAIAIGLLLIAAVAWWHSHNAGQQDIGYARAAAEYQQKLNKETAAARLKEQGWFHNSERAANERTNLENRLSQYRSAAVAADDRLRLATADWRLRLSLAPVEACRTAASAAAELLGECSAAYRQVAAAADGHAADVGQCEATWPE